MSLSLALSHAPDVARRRALQAGLGLGGLALGAAFPLVAAQAGRPEKPRLRLALGGQATLACLPVMLAQQLGFFEEAGLALEVQDHAGGPRAEEAVLQGQADLMGGDAGHAWRLHWRGLPCRVFVQLARAPQLVFGVGTQALPGFRPQSGAQSLYGLRGRRVGIAARDSAAQWFARQVLERGGVSAGQVQWVVTGLGQAAVQALRGRRVEAIVNLDPAISQLELSGEIQVLADTRSLRATQQLYGGPMPGACLSAPLGFIERYPKTVQALTHAVVRALKWLQTAGPGDLVRAVPSAHMAGDRAVYLMALDKLRESYSPDGELHEQAVLTLHRMMARHGRLEPLMGAAASADRLLAPASLYTNEFVLRARRQLML